jgi:hypothetical protein
VAVGTANWGSTIYGLKINCQIDNVFCITQMIEKKKATNRELHLLFIDLTKAYDSVPLNKLWETLDGLAINTSF